MTKRKRKPCLSKKARHRLARRVKARRNTRAHFERNRKVQRRKIDAAKAKGILDTLMTAAALGLAIATYVKTF